MTDELFPAAGGGDVSSQSAVCNPQSAISDAAHAAAVGRLNPGRKGLGRKLPEDPAALNALLARLVGLLRANERGKGSWLTGERIASQLGLSGARAVRMLTSYARFALRVKEIVALPGWGYRWGGSDPKVYAEACEMADRYGRDWFAISRIYGGGSTALAFAQKAFDWFPSLAGRLLGTAKGKRADELQAMLDEEKATIGDVIDAMLAFMTERPEVYGRDLERIANRHAAVLVSRADAEKLAQDLEATARKVRGLVGSASPCVA